MTELFKKAIRLWFKFSLLIFDNFSITSDSKVTNMKNLREIFLIFSIIAIASALELDLNKMCRGKLFESLAHPTDPNLFIGCVQQKGTLLGCNSPDEVFDPFSVSCIVGEIPTYPEHEELCQNVVFGVFPVDDDCRSYVVCDFSRPHIRECPESTVFNRHLPGCVPGNVETCEFEFHTTPEPTPCPTEKPTEEPTDPPSTTAPPPTTTPRTTTPRSGGDVVISFNCPNSGSGNIPHPDDCARFFECNRGIRFPRDCPENQIFDVITKNCNDPEVSLCAVGIQCV